MQLKPVKSIAWSLHAILALVAFTPALAKAQKRCGNDGATLRRTGLIFVVDQRAHILSAPKESIRETDEIIAHVVTTEETATLLRIVRTSSLRGVGLGAITGVDAERSALSQIASTKTSPCTMEVLFRDLASGVGSIAIRLVTNTNNAIVEVPLGVLDFRVEPDPIGAFSIGPTRLDLPNPTFKLLRSATDTVITIDDQSAQLAYAVFYTPYLWNRRPGTIRAFSVSVGTSITNIQDNVLFGVSYEFKNGITLLSGLHLGRVNTIDPRLGAGVNESVSSLGLTAVPTIRQWRRGWFYTVGLDPRILSQLFKVAGATSLPDR